MIIACNLFRYRNLSQVWAVLYTKLHNKCITLKVLQFRTPKQHISVICTYIRFVHNR
jgi:hypothetical protein